MQRYLQPLGLSMRLHKALLHLALNIANHLSPRSSICDLIREAGRSMRMRCLFSSTALLRSKINIMAAKRDFGRL
ncbi:hypothetical protein TMatcc_006922 [Talaromyces marneffei ATCC 18224]